jgi:hypothetical protein
LCQIFYNHQNLLKLGPIKALEDNVKKLQFDKNNWEFQTKYSSSGWKVTEHHSKNIDVFLWFDLFKRFFKQNNIKSLYINYVEPGEYNYEIAGSRKKTGASSTAYYSIRSEYFDYIRVTSPEISNLPFWETINKNYSNFPRLIYLLDEKYLLYAVFYKKNYDFQDITSLVNIDNEQEKFGNKYLKKIFFKFNGQTFYAYLLMEKYFFVLIYPSDKHWKYHDESVKWMFNGVFEFIGGY